LIFFKNNLTGSRYNTGKRALAYLGETALAVLADKVGPWSHSTSVGRAPVLRIVGHNSKHLELIEGSLDGEK
jgi:hypothetical protein